MKRLRCFVLLVALLIGGLGWGSPVTAHPLGNFTINHYAELKVSPDLLAVDVVLDFAEIPAFQAITQLDTNHNRKPDPTEANRYASEQCRAILPQMGLHVNGHPQSLVLDQANIEFPPGIGGLSTLRLGCELHLALASTNKPTTLEFDDKSYSQRLGWREITVISEGIPIQSDSPSTSISHRLRDYPTPLLSSPLDQRQVTVELNPAGSITHPDIQKPASSQPPERTLLGRRNDPFTRLITLEKLDPITVVVALIIAFVWGGIHALSPGHGKTVVGAYLVGSRGTAQHALFLGLTATLTHTAGIFALGLLTLGASQFLVTEQLFPWLSVCSGMMVIGISIHLLINRLKSSRPPAQPHHTHEHPHGHPHGHLHDPTHSHDHPHPHHHGDGHGHVHPHPHSHTHDHHHPDHEHGVHPHSHLPPGADGSPVTWSSLLALGISGGLLPCPSALVVLLSAIALGRIGFGLALVSAFSLGLAGVLTGIGLLLIYARRWFEQMPIQIPRVRLLPAMSALLMALIGLGITMQALIQIGQS